VPNKKNIEPDGIFLEQHLLPPALPHFLKHDYIADAFMPGTKFYKLMIFDFYNPLIPPSIGVEVQAYILY
jgi:hypothetical protein